ncbi:hypothetical protein I7I53_07025 [Histoplasma capsulatum var. duboisii H88]|uniref:Uncharacterized protein n=2 Tax=Ajellomyces capsulatus TaxID=5037 RepID=A0A8A1LG96_AJEC8|nr:predicted protein [Histoplasma capsulatum H143]QSS51653.1 hypothetical protein I7I53_07025 [Histoplasma capsulatum var. duboisii H88]
MAATLIPLNEDAEKYRNALEEWISQAEQWQDFTVDAKGNRRYLDRSIEPHVLPLLKSLGLPVEWGFTLWRFSITEFVDQLQKDIYTIPINIVTGNPQFIVGSQRIKVVLGHYTTTQGDFQLTPELDCLFVGERPKT